MLRTAPVVPGLVLTVATAALAATPWRVQAISGAPQSAWSYVASASTAYVTPFPKALVVRLIGHHELHAAVRFSCVSPGCTLAPSDQPDAVSRVNPQSYDVKSDDQGNATVSVTLQIPSPGTYVVVASPVVDGKPQRRGTASFALTAR
jgi:hypothetical protein